MKDRPLKLTMFTGFPLVWSFVCWGAVFKAAEGPANWDCIAAFAAAQASQAAHPAPSGELDI